MGGRNEAGPPGRGPGTEGLRERHILHELVRTSLSRSEDLGLLEKVRDREEGFRGATAASLINECSIREEWRVQKEKKVVGELQNFHLSYFSDGQQTLANQMLALKEVFEEEQKLDRGRARKEKRPPALPSFTPTLRSAYGASPFMSTVKVPQGPGPSTSGRGGAKGKGKGARPNTQESMEKTRAVFFPAKRADGGRARPSTAPAQSRKVDSTHTKIRRLQQNLDFGLQDFKSAEGLKRTFSVLESNVWESQAVFGRCAGEARAVLDSCPDAGGTGSRKAWAARILLGNFGLHSNDLATAEEMRKGHFAKVVQRRVREFLKRRAGERAQEERRKLEEREAHLKRCAAAVRIQSCVRRRSARKRAKVLRVERLRAKYSVRKIEEAYRHLLLRRKRQRRRRENGEEDRKRSVKWFKGFSQRVAQHASLLAISSEKDRWLSAVVIQSYVRRYLTRVAFARRMWSVERLQAGIRGWHVRRDNWWRRALGRLSARRETVARWGAHAARARPGLGTQRGMVRQYDLLAQERARVKREMAEEERKFLGSWQVFERSLKHDALKRPLAKGWIPQVDGVTGRRYYLNLKTGELHKIHPNLHNMLPQIAKERERQRLSSRPASACWGTTRDTSSSRATSCRAGGWRSSPAPASNSRWEGPP